MREVGIGVLGPGWVAGEHVKAYSKAEGCRVVALAGRDRGRTAARAEEMGLSGVRSYDSLAGMLADPDVDAVSICTPPNQHPEQIELAAAAGKHLLIEKAVANDPASLGRACRAVEKAGVRTVVSFVLHWNPQFQWIRRMLEEGAIGPIFYAETDYWHFIGPHYAQYAWNVRKDIAGSVLLSAGCHAVDALRYFVEDEVVEVSAYANKRDPNYEYPTNLVGILRFGKGAIGKVSASFDVRCPYAFNIDLLGERGAIRDNHIYAAEFFGGQTDWITVPTIRPDSGDVTHHPFEGEIAHFVECVTQDKQSPLNLADAAKTHAVCYALDRSAELERPVALNEIYAEME